jgi:C-terminal processing protease CtpA/Prc
VTEVDATSPSGNFVSIPSLTLSILNHILSQPCSGAQVAGVTEVDANFPSGNFVAHITPGSPADLCGRVRVGDEILAIDGVNVQRLTHAECLAQVRTFCL